uniref:Uncharacterized protein n=1 Tax=Plectus sambesii TaxID=2011161 RepID=A0A914X0P1_9BILA
MWRRILLLSLSLLAIKNEAKPDTIEVIQDPGFLGIGAKTEIVDFKPNGVEEVIDINKGFLGLGASTTVRDYYYNPYGYNYGKYYNNYYGNRGYYNYGYGNNNNYYNNYNRGYYYG